MSVYQMMPPLSDNEYAALKADIQENGIQIPVVVTDDGTIVDGHHRAAIAKELGRDCPTRTIESNGMSQEALRSLAFRMNANRRQLTPTQRRDLIRTSLLKDPSLSDRAHAMRCGLSDHKTVGRVRKTLERSGALPHLQDRKGSDGRKQPAARKPRKSRKQESSNVIDASDRFPKGAAPIETPAERKYPKCQQCGGDILLEGREVCAKCEPTTAEQIADSDLAQQAREALARGGGIRPEMNKTPAPDTTDDDDSEFVASVKEALHGDSPKIVTGWLHGGELLVTSIKDNTVPDGLWADRWAMGNFTVAVSVPSEEADAA